MKIIIALMACGAALLAQTAEVDLRLSTVDGQTSFRLGESIALELSFTSTVAGKYSASGGNSDRAGMENFREEFRVSPSVGTSDPLADHFAGGMATSGNFWLRELSAKPVVVDKQLNEWLHFDQPGHYQVRVISRRVSEAQKPVTVESNAIDIELLDDPEWRARELAEVVRVLRTVPKGGDSVAFEQRMQAARQLWYLDTPESIRESVRLFDGEDVQVEQKLQLGLMASSRRALAIRTLEQFLADPAHPVTQSFLDTLAWLKCWSEIPVIANSTEALRQRWARQASLVAETRNRLAGLVEQKAGAAKAISLRTVLDAAWPDSVSPVQRAEMASLFFDLPVNRQSEILDWQWNRYSGPAMIPVLRKIYDRTPEKADTAIRRLFELDPVQGRTLILAEIARPVPRLSFETLSILPDATLPELEETLAANLEQGPSRWANSAVEELIARYASARVLERMKVFYARLDREMRSRTETVGTPPRRLAMPACEPPLYAYFLRADPPYGEKTLRDAMAERSFEMGNCWMRAIVGTARYFVNSQWEKVALDGLNDSTVVVKIGAVQALGEHGSPAAREGLWAGFVYWHDWWKNKPSEVNEENRRLEAAYVKTMSQAVNWVATGEDLERAASLCITPEGCGQVAQARQYWSHPLQASVGQSSDGSFYFNLAQYEARSLEAARRRLLELPAGTRVNWKQTTWENRTSAVLDAWAGKVREELRAQGVTVVQ